MRKIVARLFGGLGNQMFIYATARAISERTGANLVLDVESGFKQDDFGRSFALNNFNVQYTPANRFERFDFPFGREVRYLFRRFNTFLPERFRFYWTDLLANQWFYIQALSEWKPYSTSWIEGYWQSPRYFAEIRDILIKDLANTSLRSQKTREVEKEIAQTNSVCVHLRMLRNQIKGIEIGTAPKVEMQYFKNCFEYLSNIIPNPHFFCFSDNPEVSRNLQNLPYQLTFVTHNNSDSTAHEDFYLMSKCRHFILSNSTFGWWAAWLGQKDDSIVQVPSVPFWDNIDILPENWLSISPNEVALQ